MVGDKQDQEALRKAMACPCGYDEKARRIMELLQRQDAVFWSDLNLATYRFWMAYLHNEEGCQAFHEWADRWLTILGKRGEER